ncbi:MAG: TIGR03643 family protein [Psychrobacter sp.]|nr:TIGR03643 family protein [Psychrobacter sp.]MDN5891015.1 TIGR03643 family protein [Psychrobacter sp.]MDN5897435.1 TIGR03643 family protein [Psychrobacter sp.]
MISNLTAQVSTGSTHRAQATQSSLNTMQADMTAALKNKQQNSMAQQGNSKSEATHEKSTQATTDRSLDAAQLSRVIEMAWEDRTPFDAIEHSYGFNESGVIKLMRQQLKPSSFRLWRQRVTSRATKHQAKRSFDVGRAYCKTQYKPR